MTNLYFRFTILYPSQKVCVHLNGREVSIFGCGQKGFIIRVKQILRFFNLTYPTYYFDLYRFKSFQIIVKQEKKGNFTPFDLARHNQFKRASIQLYFASID